MLYCIVGASGSGKSTVVNKLIEKGYKAPDSYTTRPKRFPNEGGHTYITEEEYDKLENIVAHTVFNGYRYCVTKDMLDNCDLYIVDPAGVKSLLESGYSNVKVIGLKLEPSECAIRMLSRGDNPKDITSRLDNDWNEFKDFEKICDYTIDAMKDIDTIVEEIIKIMEN